MSGNGNGEFENGEMKLWLRNKSMIQEKKGRLCLTGEKKRPFASITNCLTLH